MTWQTRADCDDPCDILERKQEREQRERERSKRGKQQRAIQLIHELFEGKPLMTQDESEQVEQLLLTWYLFERSYRPALGAPRVSSSCRGHKPEKGATHDDGSDADERIARGTAEAVESCVDELVLDHRIAIQTHMRNQVAASVFRNPRLGSPEQAHSMYMDAKVALWPKLKRKGLVK